MSKPASSHGSAAVKRVHGGFSTLYCKELADHFHSARFKLVFALLILTSLASLYGALQGIADSTSSSSEFIFLALYTSSSNSIPSVASFLAYLTPLAGLVLGFDAVNRERSQGTLNRLVSQPIHRDSVIVAKFLAGMTVIAIMVFFVGILVGGLGLVSIGIPPVQEELLRIGSYLLLTVFYTSMWMGLAMLCSVLCRHAATSALIVIALWIYFTLFASMVTSIIANLCYPVDGIQGYYNMMSNYELQLTLSRTSPYYLYCEAVSTLLNPNVRTIGITTQESLSGALASYLSFDQSLLLIWPHLTSMVALTMAAFTVSYIAFMRQEIRA
ncbi:MAG: ABC transporter permease [Candidatus Faecivicinus sp.]